MYTCKNWSAFEYLHNTRATNKLTHFFHKNQSYKAVREDEDIELTNNLKTKIVLMNYCTLISVHYLPKKNPIWWTKYLDSVCSHWKPTSKLCQNNNKPCSEKLVTSIAKERNQKRRYGVSPVVGVYPGGPGFEHHNIPLPLEIAYRCNSKKK